MKELLYVLFYQAIVAVNVAVILSAIIWLAKRKEEKDGRKPNPDFTPPPEKKPPAPQTTLCDNCCYRNQLCHKTGIRKCSNYIKAELPKPPTTGSAAIKPKYGISTDEAAKLFSKLTEASACLGGNSELDELRERVKDLADRLDRVEKKPVTPERLKEAGFRAEPVNIFNPAKADFLDAKCGDCKFFVNSLNGGYCTRRGWAVKAHEKRQCCIFEKYEAPVRTTHICKNCKHYLATDEDATSGLCGMKDEIAFGNSYKACFEKREKE